jgi:hypothetical protein
MVRKLLIVLGLLALPWPAQARPRIQNRWSMTLTPLPRPPRPARRLDGLVEAATRMLVAERLAHSRVLVLVPCCERSSLEPWRVR